MSDGELLHLAAELHSMTEEAAECLKTELQTRGLTADPAPDLELPEKDVAADAHAPGKWGKFKFVNFVCGHTLVATLIPTLTVSMFIYGVRWLMEQFAPQWVWYTYQVISLPLFPLQTIVSFIFGFIAAREVGAFWKSRAASFSWVIPCLLFVPAYLSYAPGLMEGPWQHYFWSSDILTRIQQSRTTLPVLTAVAYSLGHFFGKRHLHQRQLAVRGSL